MTAVKVSQRDHTNAIADLLDTIPDVTVGRGIRNTEPDGTGQPLTPPCIVVHPLPGGGRYGDLDDVGKHATLLYQLSCYGLTQQQAEWVADQTQLLLDGLDVPGRSIQVVRADFGSSEAVRDDTVGAPWFQATPRYRIVSLS